MKKQAFGLYYDIESNLHHMDARLKVPAAFVLILLIGMLPQGAWPVLLFIIFLVIGLQISSEIPFIVLFRRSLIVIPFMAAAIPIVFTVKGEPLFQLDWFQQPLIITAEGIDRFSHIFLKSWFSVQVAILLAATTKMMSLLNALRVYRLPKTIVMIFRLMWRYLSIMVIKAQRMMRARSARSVALQDQHPHPIRHLLWQARGTGSMAGSLFIQSLEQSERVYTAMLSRGFDGEIRLLPQSPLTRTQKLVLLGWVFFCGLLFILSLLFG
jgi:cobalt/nickel transport system permease protein